MRKIIFLSLAIILCKIADAQVLNVKIGDKRSPEEPAICINPKNPAVILAAANIDNFYISLDTGKTWKDTIAFSNYNVWGDPCLITDTAGDFLFFHLSNPTNGNWIDRIVCQKYSPTIHNWVHDTFSGLNGTKAQDKEWAVVDQNTNAIYLTWTQFDEYDSHNTLDSSIILFSKSTDAGFSWSNPIRINKKAGDCIDSDETVEGAVPAVGPNGEVYVAWVGPDGIMFDKSLDGGTTWMANDKFVTSVPGGWDFNIPGISRCNGLPILVCDLSNGPNRGTLYINWSDQRNDTTDTDIWLVKSTDGGNTWSNPIRVNNDVSQHHQFFTWMTIDQNTGYLYFVFYDRRNHNDNKTDVYLAVSKNAGLSFDNYLISESPFIPTSNVFFGDYTNISVHGDIVRPIWTRLHSNKLSVWTALIDMKNMHLGFPPSTISDSESDVYPNPSNDELVFSYKIRRDDIITLSIFDANGKEITQIFSNKKVQGGMYIEEFKASKFGLSSGVYFFVLQSRNGQNRTSKFIIN